MRKILDFDLNICRGFLFFILAIAGGVLFYHHHTQVEDVAEHKVVIEESREVSENSDSDNVGRRTSLSAVRSNMSTLSLPSIRTGLDDELSPAWAEHNFHTPQPYKTPHPHQEEDKKLTFRSIPIIRT